MKSSYVGLVGDVGGTNARLALVDNQGHVRNPKIFPAHQYASLTDVIEEYLTTTAGKQRPTRAVLAVAGPVMDGEIEFTNLSWHISEGELIAHFGFEAVKLINDFAAQAMACPLLEADDLRSIGPKLRAPADCPLVVMGAGTGFGVAGVVRGARGDLAVATEGGHAGFAPTDEIEVEVWRRLKAKHGRVSIERLLSGPGIHELYLALAELSGVQPSAADEIAVLGEADLGNALANQTLDRFCEIYGAVAGDFALSFGARGGVYISGGIAPRMIARLDSGGFRTRFEDKGRLSAYVREIPTFLVTHPYAAILGSAHELEQMGRM
jgi:glucokinase